MLLTAGLTDYVWTVKDIIALMAPAAGRIELRWIRVLRMAGWPSSLES
jgi:hypothetical protein